MELFGVFKAFKTIILEDWRVEDDGEKRSPFSKKRKAGKPVSKKHIVLFDDAAGDDSCIGFLLYSDVWNTVRIPGLFPGKPYLDFRQRCGMGWP